MLAAEGGWYEGRSEGSWGNVHLLSSEDQPLLDGWDSFLLFDALLYAGDLGCRWAVLVFGGIFSGRGAYSRDEGDIGAGAGGVYLVVCFDIQLYFLAGECSDPIVRRKNMVLAMLLSQTVGVAIFEGDFCLPWAGR